MTTFIVVRTHAVLIRISKQSQRHCFISAESLSALDAFSEKPTPCGDLQCLTSTMCKTISKAASSHCIYCCMGDVPRVYTLAAYP